MSEGNQLFYDYIRLLETKKPLFFLAENVAGILHKKHQNAWQDILSHLKKVGYHIEFKLLNANDFGVPQDRRRVIVVGFRQDLAKFFVFPLAHEYKPTLRDSIFDLQLGAVSALEKNKRNPHARMNHEYMIGDFSSIFLSRNRVRTWDEPSFTIQAGGRHAPIHPQAPKMRFVAKDRFEFQADSLHLYRRLSVRECARIQTFPDDFVFDYEDVAHAYKMIGNAVPVELARQLAVAIKQQLY